MTAVNVTKEASTPQVPIVRKSQITVHPLPD